MEAICSAAAKAATDAECWLAIAPPETNEEAMREVPTPSSVAGDDGPEEKIMRGHWQCTAVSLEHALVPVHLTSRGERPPKGDGHSGENSG